MTSTALRVLCLESWLDTNGLALISSAILNIPECESSDQRSRFHYRHTPNQFDIDADASEEDIKAVVAQSQKRSAVFDVITNPTNVFVDVAC